MTLYVRICICNTMRVHGRGNLNFNFKVRLGIVLVQDAVRFFEKIIILVVAGVV